MWSYLHFELRDQLEGTTVRRTHYLTTHIENVLANGNSIYCAIQDDALVEWMDQNYRAKRWPKPPPIAICYFQVQRYVLLQPDGRQLYRNSRSSAEDWVELDWQYFQRGKTIKQALPLAVVFKAAPYE